MPTFNRNYQGPGLFEEVNEQNSQHALIEAEHLLLDIADYVYAHTSLKPISKTLFLISRCLCVAKLGGGAATANELTSKYRRIVGSLNGSAPIGDDFDFRTVVAECEQHIPRVLDAIKRVHTLTDKSDRLGLVFNTLLRGKFEGGEGMGTFLTPEEVVTGYRCWWFRISHFPHARGSRPADGGNAAQDGGP